MNSAFKKPLEKVILSAIITLFTFSAYAQFPQGQQEQEVKEDFNDTELKKFVQVYKQAFEIQQNNEIEILQTIEKEDIEVDKFNEILQAKQEQKPAEEINATSEELAAFDDAAQKIMVVQQRTQEEIINMIQEEIGQKKYEEIATAYQHSPKIQQRINELLEKEMQ